MGQTKWIVEFYIKSNNKRCPTEEFLDKLSKTELVFIESALNRLSEHGNNLRRPHADYLRDNIYELRVKANQSQYRLFYFFFDGRKIIITHGYPKKTSAVRDQEIKKAIEFRNDYLVKNKRQT
jgi:phage-related protein